MSGLDNLDTLSVLIAYLLQVTLIIHFSLRRWRFEIAIRYGWLVCALSLPAVAVSLILLAGGMGWSFWLSGILYLIWAIFGYSVGYVKRIEWRSPFRWSIGGPQLLLYLATVMFYWFPLALISKPFWYGYALLFVLSTILNITSHQGKAA